MNVGYLKQVIKNLPDDMPVYVACDGVCNYNFADKEPRFLTETFAIEEGGCLFITDEYSVLQDGKEYLR